MFSKQSYKTVKILCEFFAVVVGISLFLSLPNLTFAQNKPRKKHQTAVSSKMSLKNGQSGRILEKLIPRLMKDADVPGLSIVVISNGELAWHRGFGVKNVETKDVISDDTVFEAASLSKTIFAYAVLKMVEDGKLDLDVPLNKYLPAPYIENDDRLNLITARRVLSHTTGLPNWRSNEKPLQIYFSPGERFSYSGEGFVYLQKVVEHLSGLPLEDFIKKTVFEPLGMNNSSYLWQHKYETQKAYAHDPAGKLAGRSKPSEANAAASLHTTALDYAKFVAAILNRRGIKDETVGEMLRTQVKVDAVCAVCFENPPSGKFSPAIAWGLGWGLETNPNGNSFWHWGDNGNVKAYVAGFDESKSSIIIFSNSANGLSVVDEIVGSVIGVKETALTWLSYEPYNSPTKTLLREILAGDIKAIDAKLSHGKNNHTRTSLNESQINWVGYQLMGRKRYAEAVRVLEINTTNFPKSFNVYDSLGEAYLKAGNTELAINNYQKIIEINPRNSNAPNILKRLQSQFKVERSLLDSYVGRYNAPFGILTMVRDKDRLIGQVSGEPDTIFLPQAHDRFTEAIRGTQLTFTKDENGLISNVVIELNGQKIQAMRIKS